MIEISDLEFPLDESGAGGESVHLTAKNEIYYKMYREARDRAREAKMEALANYLEAKRIKNTYFLEDMSDSDDEDESKLGMKA